MGRSGREDQMSDTTPALDEAFERMAAASFELPNGFVNHGAMACEALAMLDCTDDIDSWARRFARAGGASVDPVVPAGFEWRQALGDYHRLPEWIGYFTQAIDDNGWPAVVATWVPRLMPALRTALFHGAIRAAHAVRAIDAVDTPPRRGELARALGYWAARYREGQPASPLAQRRARSSPLRDVAGMLRSFDYAARHQLLTHPERASLTPVASDWVRRNGEAFCAGYAEAGGLDPSVNAVLLRALILDKAVYEVIYEARNRPTWLAIPLESIAEMQP